MCHWHRRPSKVRTGSSTRAPTTFRHRHQCFVGGTDIYQKLQAQKAAGQPVDFIVSQALDNRLMYVYDLCQDADDPARFAMLEEWESEDALKAHLGHPWLQDAVAKLRPMAAEQPRVHHLRPVTAGA